MIVLKKQIINVLQVFIIILLILILCLICNNIYMSNQKTYKNINNIEEFNPTTTNATVSTNATVPTNTNVPTNAAITSNATITSNAAITTNAAITSNADITSNAAVMSNTTITLNQNDCAGISIQSNKDTDAITTECNDNNNCYYTVNGCFNKSMFSYLPLNINNNIICNINPHINNTYNLECNYSGDISDAQDDNTKNNNKNNYLINTISQSNICLQTEENCNIIIMKPNIKNSNPKLSTLSCINGMCQPLVLSNSTVNKLTNDFKTNTGTLYFTDINNSKMPVIYNVNKKKDLSDYTKFENKKIPAEYISNAIDKNNIIANNINKIRHV